MLPDMRNNGLLRLKRREGYECEVLYTAFQMIPQWENMGVHLGSASCNRAWPLQLFVICGGLRSEALYEMGFAEAGSCITYHE